MTTTIERDAHPTQGELVARAVELQPLLRKAHADSEVQRKQPDEVIAALTAAGFFRLNKPRRFGGYPIDLRTTLRITEVLAEADASAGWVVGLASTAAWAATHGSEAVQQEIFADPDARFAGSGMPCPAQRVDGGLRLTGRWGYASGSPHATWAALAAAVTDGPDQPPEPYFCIVPVAELRLEDTWHTVGMRGTGSNTYVANDVFVPQHRLISLAALTEGSASGELPFGQVAILPLAGTMLGVGRAALTLATEQAPLKSMHHTVFARRSDSVGVQIQMAQAALKLKTAQLHAFGVADDLDEVVAKRFDLSYEDRARARAQFGYAAQQVLEAIQILLNVHGAASFAESSLMQQYWRDANTAARHAGLNEFVGYEIYGKALLDVDERISMMV
ncbi:acyl-CoA dehydrogenase family protein [Mycobacterium sp. 3519A]|uniref:acyl-CoA dehydrogenase family protein n=1 Tax=Mycobacterium sp. 3519A TaxID=2057184 RepID=UPI000C79FE72|nr:acyl-CoA dehydrogenase family protein [Mycobacterium sp. 3519A]